MGRRKNRFTLNHETRADIEKRLALALAIKGDKRAYLRLSQLPVTDNSSREWRVRAALAQQSWSWVIEAIAALTLEEQAQDKWQYWQARALVATGQSAQAMSIWQKLATNRSFYGFLAADKLQQPIAINANPPVVTADEIDNLQQKTEFQMVAELRALDRKWEANRQWWYAIAHLDNQQLITAAKLAQQWQWPAMAIFTMAKANHRDDVDLRFPIYYLPQIQAQAQTNQLEPAMIYGLIRQESAFDEQADSAAGAKGLMQMMPSTGKQIAGELKLHWQGEADLFDPAKNIKYGSFYFKKLLKQYQNNVLLATAAYNAGSNRVKRWLPNGKSLPADIWLETLPYKETRGYVTSVLMYTLIYQQRLQSNGLKLADFMREIPTH